MTSQSFSGFANINGAPLYYDIQGEGYPLLLIHAGVADSRMWDTQVDVFAKHFRVIRFDLRGFGQSHMPTRKFAYHADVKSLLDFLQIEKVHVVGISFGGRTALDFTLAYPAYVSALVLGAPSVGGTPPSQEIIRFGEEEKAFLQRGDLMGAAELNVRMWVDGPNRQPEQVNPSVRQSIREMQYIAFTIPVPDGFDIEPLHPPAIQRLVDITVPTLVLIGDQDVSSTITTSNHVAASIPNAKKIVMRDVAHILNMEKPEEFNRLVMDFLRVDE